jgi:secondary thiamine-phosphate synthase enzyme
VNEGADPDVIRDFLARLEALVPWEAGYRHAEGNSAAHIKSILVGPGVVLPVSDGRLSLGTWQDIYFCEFDGPRQRSLELRYHPGQ